MGVGWEQWPIEVALPRGRFWPPGGVVSKRNRDPDIMEWLTSRLGSPHEYRNQVGRWIHTIPLSECPEVVIGFREEDRDVAVLFKLTWL